MDAIAKRPTAIPLEIVNLKPEDLKVNIVDDVTGEKIPVVVDDNLDGTFSLNFTPTKPGMLTCEVIADGSPAEGLPLKVKVAEPPTATYNGPKNITGEGLSIT